MRNTQSFTSVTRPLASDKKTRGKLFVFEGPDDVGKTSLATMLTDHLEQVGFSSKLLSFPGREPNTVSELIYRLYHDPPTLGVKTILPITMQVMVTAAHIEVIEARVRPLIDDGINVVLDRFWWSTWVYATIQGISEKARDLMIELEMQSWQDIIPDRVFLILRREPLLTQPPNHRWPELVCLYKELPNLQRNMYPINVITNDGRLADAFEEIVVSIRV